MGRHDKMFRVIVLGGVALVDCGARTDLGRSIVEDASKDAGADATEEDVAFGFPAIDAAPFDGTLNGDVIFPPAEANAPIPPDAESK